MLEPDGEIATVGVVLTSYQQGEQVVEAVRSVQAQTRVPAEIIVVDDGSEDELTLRVLNELESDVKVIR